MNLRLIAKNQTDRVKSLPLLELHCHAKIENSIFLDKMVDSIEQYGMQNPIIILPMSIGQWLKMKYNNPDILDPPTGEIEQEVLQIRCGNNRYRAAHMLGYEMIDCIVAENLRDASTLCNQQRAQHNIWHMENKYGDWNR